MTSEVLNKIITFGYTDKDIRAVILEGSLAVGAQVDALSDYDINIYARSFEGYLTADRWMSQFGEVLLYQKEEYLCGNHRPHSVQHDECGHRHRIYA